MAEESEAALGDAGPGNLLACTLWKLCSSLLSVVFDARAGAVVVVVLDEACSLVSRKASFPRFAVVPDLFCCGFCSFHR